MCKLMSVYNMYYKITSHLSQAICFFFNLHSSDSNKHTDIHSIHWIDSQACWKNTRQPRNMIASPQSRSQASKNVGLFLCSCPWRFQPSPGSSKPTWTLQTNLDHWASIAMLVGGNCSACDRLSS